MAKPSNQNAGSENSLTASMLPPAGLLRRLGALIYDGLLVIALWFTTAGILTLINGGEAVGGAWFKSLLFIETYIFCAWFWLRNQATLGMQAWHLQIQTLDGGQITPRQTVVRYLASLVALLPFGLGYWWVLIDPANRSWQDIASDTQIVCTLK